MSQNKLTSSPTMHRLLDGYLPGTNETSTFCAYGKVCLNGINVISNMSSPFGQEAAFGVYQNSDRFKVKFSTLSYWHGVRTVNIATL